MYDKKRGVFIYGLLLIIFLGVTISADTCSIVERSSCGDNIVMGLYSSTNAHAELGTESNYNYVLCCDFGSGDLTCDGENKIVGLSSVTNAHAEIPSLNNYLENVCYENVKCSSNSGSCQSGYDIEILSLFSDTNAHIGEFNDYLTKICCCVPDCADRECGPAPNGCGAVDECGTCSQGECNTNGRCFSQEAYWANKNDPRYAINSIEVIPGISQVSLVLKNSGLTEGTLDFEVYEDDFFIDDSIRTGDSVLKGNIYDNETGISYWTIEDSDLAKTFDFGEFYFLVNSQASNDLEIILSTGTCVGMNYCTDYTTEEMCESDTCVVAERSVESINEDITCGEDYDYICKCVWDDSNLECDSAWSFINGTLEPDVNLPGLGTCNYEGNTNDDCADGFLTYSWGINIDWPSDNSGWVNQAGCISGGGDSSSCVEFSTTIESGFDNLWHYDIHLNGENQLLTECRGGSNILQCPAQIQLAFFTIKNLIITLFILIGIYILYNLKDKKKKKRTKKKKK